MASSTETLILNILAKDSDAVAGLLRTGQAAKDAGGNVTTLNDKLKDLARRSAEARVGLQGDKAMSSQLDKLQLKVLDLAKKKADPEVNLAGYVKTLYEIDTLSKKLDDLGKKQENVFVKLSKSGFVQPSGKTAAITAGAGLVPAAVSGLVATGGLITAAFGAAAIGVAAFGVLAKSALSQASTAANAVETAQNNYNIAIAHGTKQSVAYKAEQTAIAKAYAEMSPAQIALSKQVGAFSDAWQNVQKSITPVISGALAPWLAAVTKAMVVIKPLITPIAATFQAWGQQLDKYFSSSKGSTQIRDIARALGQFAAIQLNDIITFIKDLGVGIFNLGKDIGANHVQYGQFGGDLAKWGDAFASWSKSKAARDDVSAFVHWLRENGSTLGSIIKDLAKYIPGIFAGATAAGTLELKTLSTFLGWVAKLPPSWAKPLTEVAGALLLLSKTGVLKIGIQVVGAAAKWLSGGTINLGGASAAEEMKAAMVSGGEAAAAEIRAAFTGGGAVSGAGGAAGAAAGEAGAAGAGAGILSKAGWAKLILRGGLAAGFGLALTQAIGQVGQLLPKSSAANIPSWAQNFGGFLFGGKQNYDNLTGAFQKYVQDPVRGAIKSMWDDITSTSSTGAVNAAAKFNTFRAGTVKTFDNLHLGVSATWGNTWSDLQKRTDSGRGDVSGSIAKLRDNAQSDFNQARSSITKTWDDAWNQLHGTAKDGTTNVGTQTQRLRDNVSNDFDQARHNVLTSMDKMQAGVGDASRKIQGDLNALHSVHRTVALDLQLPKGVSLGHKATLSNFAGGTTGAPAGWAWVGERGPELVHMRGGETVIPTHKLGGFADGVINLNTMGPSKAQIAQIGVFQRIIGALGAAAAGAAKLSPSYLSKVGLGSPGTSAGGQYNLGALENLWQQAGGPGGYIAHIAGAIALAESGGNPRAFNPSGASGLWQILGQVVAGNVFNPFINALNAVKKYDDARGFSPWVTYETGAYRAYMDRGGWLRPGKTLVTNNTGRPERVLPPGGQTITLIIEGRGDHGRYLADQIRKVVRVDGGGDVQVALGS